MTERKAKEKRSVFEVLGPGLVTGAADDDPSGIGTYSQVGAEFGYKLGWTMPFAYPFLAATQLICGEVGAVTGKGIAANLKDHYPRAVLQGAVLLLLVANIINLGADLGAMGAVVAMLVPGPAIAFTLAFGLLCAGLEIWISYARYAHLLKWATLSLFAYVGVLLVAKVDWPLALHDLVVPSFSFTREEAMALVAVFGTTISPYLFFWQAGQEVEEQHAHHTSPLRRLGLARSQRSLKQIRTDTLVGMAFSHGVALAIVLATAATLHQSGVTDIQSAAQAAEALRPVAGDLAFALFACGIIGTGLLAIPVLAGSAAYAVSETMGWCEGLDKKPGEAKGFYAVIMVATIGGVALNLIGIDPMKALYWTAVVNGLLAPPLMLLLMLLASNPKVMGRLTISPILKALGWASTAVMSGVALLFLLS
ncbi:NRAMP family divalent metal transporter [Sphingomonas jaspsi]|uniref:NRAMP family divalent metal transporter n=1 Tax=Sphingomonas jaspsi TaxID=392409 RepID=UPI0004B6047C|nr:divalent metal cation transporter [Sphingomonas jaspsi]